MIIIVSCSVWLFDGINVLNCAFTLLFLQVLSISYTRVAGRVWLYLSLFLLGASPLGHA